ncbi:EAL domain-containing protein [Shewanella sp. SR44-3]|uniref:EAL domain-containing protein n=3 Tax=unclassified Shewanella TaxID=196818 RepID=UPI0015FB7A13|nr:EAL domain-containing protein [Shewanella sp. SR44-3]MBB1269553.1 EAL domain-containing protein [Shewanella sp. SR44-3]
MPISRFLAIFTVFFCSYMVIYPSSVLAFGAQTASTNLSDINSRVEPPTKKQLVNKDNRFKIKLNYDSYNIAEGVSQSRVNSMVEDRFGYIWIGTLNGLNRFDGTNFEHFFADDSNGLPSSFIRSLLIDGEGNLLVGTDAGLVVYNNDTEKFYPFYVNNEKLTSPIWSLSLSKDKVFIGMNNKILIQPGGEIKNEQLKEVKKVISIAETIYIRNYDGEIFSYKNNILKLFEKNSLDMVDTEKKLIIALNNGLYESSLNSKKHLSNNVYYNFSKRTSDNELISIHNGEIITPESEESQGVLSDNPKEFGGSLIKEVSESTLITKTNEGFLQIKKNSNLVRKIHGIDENIWSMAKSSDGDSIFIADDNEKIKIFNRNMQLKGEVDVGASFGPKLVITFKGALYTASSNGLYITNLVTYENKKISSLHVTALTLSDNEDLIIAGTIDGEILKILNQEVIQTLSSKDDSPIYDILYDNGNMWIASQSGLMKISKASRKKIFSSDLVTSIKKYKNKLYVGTRTALLSIDEISNETKEIHAGNKAIYAIHIKDDHLSASSNSEIIILNIETQKKHILQVNNGAQTDYNIQSMLDINENIIFGGVDGLSILNTHEIMKHLNQEKAPSVLLSSFSLFNIVKKGSSPQLKTSISSSKQVNLKFSDYPFSFKFIVPGKTFDEVEFYYQMQGLSNNWLPAKEVNSATYTNLSHGEYLFNVYAVDKLTGKQGPTKSIKVIITPPWWLSLEAKFVYALLTFLFVSALLKTMVRRREVQKQIALSEERLKLSLWGSGDEMWDWDIESGKIYRSNIWGTLEFPQDGQRSGQVDGESNIHPQDQERVKFALNQHFNGMAEHFEVTYRVRNRSNEWLWILDRAKIVERDNNERPLRMTGTIKDINNIKQTEEQLRLFARAIENISEGMFILDANHQFVEVNAACCELLQRTKLSFHGERLSFTLYPESFSIQIRSLIAQQGYWSGEIEALKADETTFLMSLTIDAIKDELGQFSHYVGIFSDITRRKLQEEELRKLTNNDILTGLANRSSLQVTLSNLVKKDIHHTLMVLDLDNFKRINDSLGHQIGDSLIIKVAERIQTTIPSHASLYRLGGDEFAILLDKNPDIASSAAIAGSIIESLKSPFTIESEQLVVGLSIGIVLYPEDEQNEQALLRKADIAMYHAKSGGGNRYQFYAESLNQNVLRQLEVENLIRQGLKDDLFEVYYQAKVDLKQNRITGMEALVRLNHPELGIIAPNEFIPLAEESGLIIEIGDIVLRKACTAAQKWRQQGIFNGRIAVNLSSKQFALPNLVQGIESILRQTQLPAANLELEITEGTVIKNPESAIKVMQQLAKMGICLALDDFGTGYSSLSYLKRFPIHRLKVDKSFVDDIDKSDMDLKMVDSIITIAHNMGLTVVGEGVEQAAQLSILKALNCEEVQGYIFSKPVPETDFTQLLVTDSNKDKQEDNNK